MTPPVDLVPVAWRPNLNEIVAQMADDLNKAALDGASIQLREKIFVYLKNVMTTGALSEVGGALSSAQAALSEVVRERDALREALKPFAETAEHDIGSTETDEDIFQQAHHNRAPKITVGHFRRARAASGGSSGA